MFRRGVDLSGRVTASFADWTGTEPPTELEEFDDGTCRAVQIVSGTGTAWVPRESAGTITVSGLLGPGETVVLEPTCGPFGCDYLFEYPESDLFAPLSLVTVRATGDEVPPFELSSIAPSPLVVISPSLETVSSSADLGFVPGEPFSVTWESGDGQQIGLGMSTEGTEPVFARLNCLTEDDGQLIVAPEATALLGSVGPPRSIVLYRFSVADVGYAYLMVADTVVAFLD